MKGAKDTSSQFQFSLFIYFGFVFSKLGEKQQPDTEKQQDTTSKMKETDNHFKVKKKN